MEKSAKIYVAGHKGMVGSAIVRKLKTKGYTNLFLKTRNELDLTRQSDVAEFFRKEQPEYVFLAAARVGGIKANSLFPVEFLRDNILIQTNVIEQCYRTQVKKVIFLGSSCIYPKNCPQPMKEEHLLSGRLEPTNEGYALAKISGIKLVQYSSSQYGLRSLSVMPCNLYGQNDSFDLNNSHVLSALVRKFVDAVDENKEVTVWGSGIARREFLHVDDLADALLFLVENWHSTEIINVGSGEDISIKGLVDLIAAHVNYNGKIHWDTSMPDGMLRKCLDVSKLHSLGFHYSITLDEGIKRSIEEYRLLKSKGLV